MANIIPPVITACCGDLMNSLSTVLLHECGHILVAQNSGWDVVFSMARIGNGGCSVCIPNESYFSNEFMVALWNYVDSGKPGIEIKKEILRNYCKANAPTLNDHVRNTISYIIAGSLAEGRAANNIQGTNADSDNVKLNVLKCMLSITDKYYHDCVAYANSCIDTNRVRDLSDSFLQYTHGFIYLPVNNDNN